MVRPDLATIYCPLWHSYDHASSWKGEGWCEWELLKTAPPRFAGHAQPLKPSWGCYDESDPIWSAREIDLAADHGIDVFIFDWYWYSGVRLMEETLERGFLKAPNRQRLKFALMWANHDWWDYFPSPFDGSRNMWLPQRHSRQDMLRIIDYGIDKYFREPNYWRIAGKLFFSVFAAQRMIDEIGGPAAMADVFGAMDQRLNAAGLPELHRHAMLDWRYDPDSNDITAPLKAAGFHSWTNYNIITGERVDETLIEDYEQLIAAHEEAWPRQSRSVLPYQPVLTMGWDVTPRAEHDVPWPFPVRPHTQKHTYPYGSVVVNNTPDRFRELCTKLMRHLRESQAEPYAVFINAWNEWTEGSYLLPEERFGTGHLESLRNIFGVKE